jgi:ADP-ribose pyrophosphatase
MKNPWKTLQKNKIYEDKFGFRLRQDDVITPNGKEGKYTVFEGDPYVAVVALTKDKKILLVKQWRYALEQEVLSVVAGKIDAGETPEQAARRELKEEAGAEADEYIFLCDYYTIPGVGNIKAYAYLALNVSEGQNSPEGTEDISLEKMDFHEAVSKIFDDTFKDEIAKTSILLAYTYLENVATKK